MMRMFLQGSSPVFLLVSSPQRQTARFKLAALLVAVSVGASVHLSPTPPAPATVVAGKTQANKPASVPQPTAQQVNAAPEPKVLQAATSIPTTVAPEARACRANYSYHAPAQAPLGAYGLGLTVLRDAVSYYQVYGYTYSDIRNQIRACGPLHEYAADSSYSINWSYALGADETGSCRAVGVKVGVHTAVLLPYREETGSDSRELLNSWQRFSDSLRLHENGHVALAEQYASQLLYNLQAYPAGDCYTMGPGVEAMANGLMNQLERAQAQYDSTTNHGATQGALF